MRLHLSIANWVFAITLLALAFIANAQDVSVYSGTDITYLNGGIGSEESEAIRLQAPEFPVHITFSEGKDGKSITDVALKITNHDGFSAFELPSAGPILYIKLPDGIYDITSQYGGITKLTKLKVLRNKSANVYLNWEASSDDATLEQNKSTNETESPIPATEAAANPHQ
ncbi:MAG TPA: hypothetical protein VK974_01005 [Methylophilaceae bacterium]|nr:hypothetical protein [Methylophilaceae bacterium]